MTDPIVATVTRAEHRPRERFDDPTRGDAEWFTLFSAGVSPTEGITAGITELAPGGPGLAAHRHAQPEIYYILEGSGVVTIDGAETAVSPGDAVFIPGDAEHSLRNPSSATLKLLYVFAVDRFSDVVYRFSPDPAKT